MEEQLLQLVPWLGTEVLGNPLAAWIVAAVLLVGVTSLVLLAIRYLVAQLSRLASLAQTGLENLLAETLGQTSAAFALALGTLAAVHALELRPNLDTALRTLVVVVVLLQAGMWASATLRFFVDRLAASRMAEDPMAGQATGVLRVLGRLLVWTLVVLLVLANLGIDITAVIAGLGIGGVAVALAVQNILSDIFASLSIVIDRPFVVGDFIIVGELLGTVEHIGIKTTRVRSLSGEQLVFANNDLLTSRIRNFKRMQHRRVVFHVHVAYGTPYEKLASLGAVFREIVETQELARFDRAHLQAFTDQGIRYEIVWNVLVADFNTYMDLQEAMNLAIVQRFEEEGIAFAFPLRTLHLQGPLGTQASPQSVA